jgi:hypothetical protein
VDERCGGVERWEVWEEVWGGGEGGGGDKGGDGKGEEVVIGGEE